MSTNLFKKYETSNKRENEGTEIDIDGAVFICRRAGGANRRYRAALGMIMSNEDLKKQLYSEDKTESIIADDEITLQAVADSVVIGWRNVLDRDDKEWEFSKDNFLELMRACPDVWFQLMIAVRNIENFRVESASKTGEELGKS